MFFDMAREPKRARVPWATIVATALIVVANFEVAFGGPPDVVWRALANDYDLVSRGQLWRLFTFWVPHLHPLHLWPDVIYLAIVGGVLERNLGRRWVMGTFLIGNFVGGLLAFLFDAHHVSLCGSSDGTHAMLIGVSVLFIRAGSLVDIGIGVGSIVWTIYHTITGLMTGWMGWPMQDMANGGFDHVGGVVVGFFAGGVLLVRLQEERAAQGGADSAPDDGGSAVDD
jgi:membrane associated rhomboid family serine protease